MESELDLVIASNNLEAEREEAFPEMKPCPFCDCRRIAVETGRGDIIAFCDDCFAQVRIKGDEDYPSQIKIRKLWNTRISKMPKEGEFYEWFSLNRGVPQSIAEEIYKYFKDRLQ